MLSIIPLPYKLAGVAICIAAIYAAGYWGGYSHEHRHLVEFRQAVDAAGRKQNEEAKRKDAENAENARYIADSYDADRRRLASALERMRHSSSGGMPKAPDSAEISDEASGESGGTCEGTIYERAMKDAQTLEAWQQWARSNHLPVQ